MGRKFYLSEVERLGKTWNGLLAELMLADFLRILRNFYVDLKICERKTLSLSPVQEKHIHQIMKLPPGFAQ